MSDRHIIGHISWSPDFESKPNKLQHLIDSGQVRLAPRFEGDRLVSVDLVRDNAAEGCPVTLLGPTVGRPIEFTYTNWKGKTKQRRATPCRLFWGSNEWHKEPQLLLEAHDLDKEALRTFAIKDMSEIKPVAG